MKRILIALAIMLLIFSINSFAQDRATTLLGIDTNLPSSSKLTAAQLRTTLKAITNSAFDGLDTKVNKADSISAESVLGTDRLQFIVNTTNSTIKNGDSILTLSTYIDKYINVYKNGLKLYQNNTATNGKLGFRFNTATGQIVFRPVVATNDVIIIESSNPQLKTYSYLPQNLLAYSEQLDNAVWSAGGGGGTIVANQANDVTGSATLELYTKVNENNYLAYSNSASYLTVIPSTTYRFSFDVKRGTMAGLACMIYDRTHSVLIGSVTNYYAQTSSVATRVSFSFTTPAGCTSILVEPCAALEGFIGTVYVGRMQIESNGSTYVTTTTTAIQ